MVFDKGSQLAGKPCLKANIFFDKPLKLNYLIAGLIVTDSRRPACRLDLQQVAGRRVYANEKIIWAARLEPELLPTLSCL
jgi:hypothetical protein